MEIFFVAEVIAKEIASTDTFDEYGHCILEGEKYLLVNYLNLKDDTGKKHIKYERPRKSKDAVIHLAEIFASNIALNADLKMNISEFHSLLNAAL